MTAEPPWPVPTTPGRCAVLAGARPLREYPEDLRQPELGRAFFTLTQALYPRCRESVREARQG